MCERKYPIKILDGCMENLIEIKRPIITSPPNDLPFKFKIRIDFEFGSFQLPLESDGKYDFTVYWGDGKINTVKSYFKNPIHTYSQPGEYIIIITGICIGWRFDYSVYAPKVIDILRWGNIEFGNNGYYFSGCENMQISAWDVPNLIGTTNLEGCFQYCYNLNSSNLSIWDMSRITNMSKMFEYAENFNEDLNKWDVSKVTNMSTMFYEALAFDMPLINWNVGLVTNMQGMFFGAQNFNQDLNDWNVSSVKNMGSMFYRCQKFNKPLNKWNVENVLDMNNMFNSATEFKQDISSWNPILCKSFYRMFYNADMNLPGTTTNYDKLLLSWSTKRLTGGSSNSKIFFDAGRSKYGRNQNVIDARKKLIEVYSWNISDI